MGKGVREGGPNEKVYQRLGATLLDDGFQSAGAAGIVKGSSTTVPVIV
jgi:hypothetical protein